MSEIYWITRLDGICNLLEVLIIILIILIILSIVVISVCSDSDDDDDSESNKLGKKVLKFSIPALLIVAIMQVFTPTAKEVLMIYGVGGTIDYIKSDDVTKQLPDKCIKALDKFVDEYINEDE